MAPRLRRLGADPKIAEYGRSFLLVCGGAASRLRAGPERAAFIQTPLRLDIPEPVEICGSCRQSDAKYGKGDIPNTDALGPLSPDR